MSRRTPAHIRALEGGTGAATARQTPKPPPLAPKEPPFRSLLGAGRTAREAHAEYRRVVPLLGEMGLLARIDLFLVQDYAIAFARIQECERETSANGILVEGQRGTMVRNPATTVATQYRAQAKWLCQQLGVGASARGQMDVSPPKGEPSVLDEIIADAKRNREELRRRYERDRARSQSSSRSSE